MKTTFTKKEIIEILNNTMLSKDLHSDVSFHLGFTEAIKEAILIIRSKKDTFTKEEAVEVLNNMIISVDLHNDDPFDSGYKKALNDAIRLISSK